MTGFREDQWVAQAKALWGRGNDVLVTQPSEDGRQETVKRLLCLLYTSTFMKKNMNENFEITVDEMTEIFGDTPVEMSFREVKEGMDSFFGLMGLTVELVNLIRKEDELKKHHRAYLHVREEIAECANEATEVIRGILDSIQEKEHIYRVSGSPSAFDMDEEDEYEDCLLYTSTYITHQKPVRPTIHTV